MCLSEVWKKLDTTDLTQQEKERIVHRLLDEGYVDEARYARAFVRDKFRFNDWGRMKIAQGLRAKQISEAAIRNALTEIDDDDYRRTLRKALQAKQRTLRGSNEYERNGKLIRFALGRGFEMAVVLQELNADEDDYS